MQASFKVSMQLSSAHVYLINLYSYGIPSRFCYDEKEFSDGESVNTAEGFYKNVSFLTSELQFYGT